MAHTHFPKVGALIGRRNITTGEVTYGIVMRSEPERGFVIVLDDESFTTEILHLQQA